MPTRCETCNYKYLPAKSKRVSTCPNCACYEKTGEYLVDKLKRKAKGNMAKSRERAKAKMALKPKQAHKIKQQSKKGAQQAREVTKVKREVTEAALDGGFIECQGCGSFFDTIDRSHKVALSHSGTLASDPDNLRLLCRSCHMKWESMDAQQMIELDCFLEDMHYLLDMDTERFWKRYHKILDEHELRPTPRLGRTISQIEKFDL